MSGVIGKGPWSPLNWSITPERFWAWGFRFRESLHGLGGQQNSIQKQLPKVWEIFNARKVLVLGFKVGHGKWGFGLLFHYPSQNHNSKLKIHSGKGDMFQGQNHLRLWEDASLWLLPVVGGPPPSVHTMYQGTLEQVEMSLLDVPSLTIPINLKPESKALCFLPCAALHWANITNAMIFLIAGGLGIWSSCVQETPLPKTWIWNT